MKTETRTKKTATGFGQKKPKKQKRGSNFCLQKQVEPRYLDKKEKRGTEKERKAEVLYVIPVPMHSGH